MAESTCPKCGSSNPEGALACVRCGRSLTEDHGAEKNWPPSSTVGDEASGTIRGDLIALKDRINAARITLLVLILMMVTGSVLYRIMVLKELEQTSALFIGIPAALAMIVVLVPNSKSGIGTVLKGITLCLLMSGIFLGEGFICIMMAAPLFYGVPLLIWAIVRIIKDRRRDHRAPRMLSLIPLLLLVPLSLEGTSARLSLDRSERVAVEKIVAGTNAEVESALASEPRFTSRLPFYLRMGFPRPGQPTGTGLNPGDRRVIPFAGGEGKPGSLVLEVMEHQPGMVRFRAVSDTSHISHWLDWKEAVVTWAEVEPGKVKVSWTLAYTRRLDPAWYFRPWERYAAGLAAEYLIDSAATPIANVQ